MQSTAKPNLTDAELLAQLRTPSSADALAAIVRRHVDMVYSTALRRVRDAHLAEDVTQAVFLALLKKSPRLPSGTVLAGWLYQTSRFVSADALKMERRRRHHERQAAAVSPAEPMADETWGAVSPMLESAMDRLPDSDRDVILLRYFVGMNVGAVAEATGIPPNTAAKRIGRALEKLRTYFADHGISAPAEVVGAAISAGAIQPAPARVAVAAVKGGGSPAVVSLARKAGRAMPIAAKAAIGLSVAAAWIIGGLYVFDSGILAPSSKPAPPPAASVVPMLAGPLEPTSPQQTQQIRAAVYSLAHSTVFVQNDDWPAAMRTLIQIGRPAVPELVAELDRTQSDSALRAFGFTLRAIGDPRACPALIRALARTAPISSDCGFPITDDHLFAFLRPYQLEQEANPEFIEQHMFSYGRSIREIAGALEKITGHVEGRPAFIDAGNDSPRSLASAREKHRALSAQWQRWWDAHSVQFVDAADMATLTAHAHDTADLRAAGIAAYGPLFPTGADYHLGPVQDTFLRYSEENLDRSDMTDFDAQRTMTMLDAARFAPPDNASASADPMELSGADVACSEFFHDENGSGTISEEKLAKIPKFYELACDGITAWQVEDGRWERLAGEIAAGKPVVADFPVTEPDDEFNYYDPHSHAMVDDHFPATFLFRTRKGGAGILQILGMDRVRRGLHIHYRMVEPHVGKYQARLPAPLLSSPPFGPVQTVTLDRADLGGKCAFSFKIGALPSMPRPAPATQPRRPNQPDFQAIRTEVDWADLHHADLISSGGENGLEPLCLRLLNPTIVPLSDAAFDTVDPGLARLALDRLARTEPVNFLMKSKFSSDDLSTAAFRTHDGIEGMIQLIAVSQNPPSITFRYKLLPPTTRPAQ